MMETLQVLALVIGVAVLAVFAWGVATSLPDIQRYRRIRHM